MATQASWPDTERWPANLAACLAEVHREAHPLRRLELQLNAFAQMLRFVALCHVADLMARQTSIDPALTGLIDQLRRPSLGHWFRVAIEAGAALARLRPAPLLWEWPDALKRLRTQRWPGAVGRDLQTPAPPRDPLTALLHLRNVLAHGGMPPDEDQSSDLIARHAPMFAAWLWEMDFLASVRVLRPVQRTGAHTVDAAWLAGSGPLFALHQLDTAAWPAPWREGPLPPCLLDRADPPGSPGIVLALDPLFLAPGKEDPGPHLEPLLLFDGIAHHRVYYVGARHKVAHDAAFDRVMATLFAPPALSRRLTAGEGGRRIVEATRETIRLNRGVKYFPEVYIERAKMAAVARGFVDNAPARVSGLLLVAESGAGKTSFMCHLAAKLLAQADAVHLPLLVQARAMDWRSVPAADADTAPAPTLLAALCKVFGLEGEPGLAHAVEAIGHRLGSDFTGGGGTLLLLVDALNEFGEPGRALREFDALVQCARELPWLKLIGTMRRWSFGVAQVRLAASGAPWPLQSRAYVRESAGSGPLRACIEITGFSQDECEQAWERHRERAAEDRDAPAALTPYAQLSEPARDLARDPLLLSLMMRAFDGRELPADLRAAELFAAYHHDVLSPLQANLCMQVAGRMIALGRPTLRQEELAELLAGATPANDPSTRLLALDPIEGLVDQGVLLGGDAGVYAFAHQPYAEYLMGRWFEHTSPTVAEIRERITRGFTRAGAYFEEELSALRSHVFRRTVADAATYIPLLVAELHQPTVGRYLTPLVYQLRDESLAVYGTFIDGVASCGDAATLDTALTIFRTLGDRDAELRLLARRRAGERDALVALRLDVRRARLSILLNQPLQARSILAAARSAMRPGEPRALVEVLSEQGYLDFAVGRSVESIALYNQALGLLEGLRNTVLPDEHDTLRRQLLGGRGCAQHNIDANADCLASHLESLAIGRSLDDREGVALDLVNVADAQWGCGQPGASLRTYAKAIVAAERSCFDDALDVALIGQGTVLWSVGQPELARRSLERGLAVARRLDYAWDRAYGMLYLANLEASTGHLGRAWALNREALALAESVQADYLAALAAAYGAWLKEVLQPGSDAHRLRLPSLRAHCRDAQMRGVDGLLHGVQVLHDAANPEIGDTALGVAVAALAERMLGEAPIKGPWELLAAQVIERVHRRRPGVGTLVLADAMDALVEAKASDLGATAAQTYLASRQAWHSTRSGQLTPGRPGAAHASSSPRRAP